MSGSRAPVADWLLRHGFVLIMAGFFLFFALTARSFLTPGNLLDLLEGNAVLLILALAMTLIVASGGIDLSVGVALDFGAAFAMVALKDHGAPGAVAVLAALVGGALVGMVNAGLIVGLRVSPFLATLSVLFIGSSIERIYTEGGGPISFRKMPESYRDLATGDVLGVPGEIVLALLVLVLCWVVLEWSIHGKRLHAIGLQRRAAEVAGIPIGRYLAVTFIGASAICALGGVILSANLRQFTPLAGSAYLLQAIAAVFIGASLHPLSRPNVPGTLLGVLFLGMVANGLNLMGLDFNVKDALAGLILVGALALSIAQQRFRR